MSKTKFLRKLFKRKRIQKAEGLSSTSDTTGLSHGSLIASGDLALERNNQSQQSQLSQPSHPSDQTGNHHDAHSGLAVGNTAVNVDRQTDSDILPLNNTRTVTDRNGNLLQVETLREKSTSPEGVVIPGIARSGTYPINVSSEQGPISEPQKLLTDIDDRQEEDEIAVVSPHFATLPRRRSTRSQVYVSDVANPIFPAKISCYVDVTFEEVQKFESAIALNDFVWYDPKSYKKIKGTIQKIKDVFLEKNIVKTSDDIYLRYASCFVRGSRNQSLHEADDTMLIDVEDMEEVLSEAAILAICGFIYSHPCQLFELRVHCDYSTIDKLFVREGGLSSWPDERRPFHTAIQEEYEKKMKVGRSTIKNRRYLSPADNKVLITPDNARRIIEEDATSVPKLTTEEKTKLLNELKSRPASFLQAACVNRWIPMRFLYHLLFEAPHVEQKCSDHLDTLRLNVPMTCTDELCTKYYDRLTEHIHEFFPEVIRYDPRLSRKHTRAVVPVRYVEQRTHLGSGGFGDVYEVDLDPHCQLLSPVSFEYTAILSPCLTLMTRRMSNELML